MDLASHQIGKLDLWTHSHFTKNLQLTFLHKHRVILDLIMENTCRVLLIEDLKWEILLLKSFQTTITNPKHATNYKANPFPTSSIHQFWSMSTEIQFPKWKEIILIKWTQWKITMKKCWNLEVLHQSQDRELVKSEGQKIGKII